QGIRHLEAPRCPTLCADRVPASTRATRSFARIQLRTLARRSTTLDAEPMPRAPRPTAAGIYHLATRSTTPDLFFADGHDRLALISQVERVCLDTDWSCLGIC